MALTIHSEEAEKLAHDLARRTGRSVEDVVAEALRSAESELNTLPQNGPALAEALAGQYAASQEFALKVRADLTAADAAMPEDARTPEQREAALRELQRQFRAAPDRQTPDAALDIHDEYGLPK